MSRALIYPFILLNKFYNFLQQFYLFLVCLAIIFTPQNAIQDRKTLEHINLIHFTLYLFYKISILRTMKILCASSSF
jgi:hypothetical protein